MSERNIHMPSPTQWEHLLKTFSAISVQTRHATSTTTGAKLLYMSIHSIHHTKTLHLFRKIQNPLPQTLCAPLITDPYPGDENLSTTSSTTDTFKVERPEIGSHVCRMPRNYLTRC